MLSSNEANPVIHDVTGGIVQSFTAGYFEVGGRSGVTDYIDAGVKLALPSSILTDVKWQFFDHEAFAAAIGTGVGYMFMRTVNLGDIHLIDGTVPLYLSWDVSKGIGFYSSVRYFFRYRMDTSSFTNYGALAGGIRLGNLVGIMLELTYLKQFESTYQGFQFGTSIFFRTAPFIKKTKPASIKKKRPRKKKRKILRKT